jgi:hypothetical protein
VGKGQEEGVHIQGCCLGGCYKLFEITQGMKVIFMYFSCTLYLLWHAKERVVNIRHTLNILDDK